MNSFEISDEMQVLEVDLERGSKNPTKIKSIILESDFYTLTWISLKWDIWMNKEIKGQKVFLSPSDFIFSGFT